jgi:hypothetical protein
VVNPVAIILRPRQLHVLAARLIRQHVLLATALVCEEDVPVQVVIGVRQPVHGDLRVPPPPLAAESEEDPRRLLRWKRAADHFWTGAWRRSVEEGHGWRGWRGIVGAVVAGVEGWEEGRRRRVGCSSRPVRDSVSLVDSNGREV